MAVAVERRLPGVRFERQPAAAAMALPRMDVAAFVGIAASGPLHTPVAVEDGAQFEALFGADAPLAWDPVADSRGRAHLASAVRAFFRNGGRRCWVVRVAGPDAASAELEVPGLARIGDGGLEPAALRARSEGSWADDLRVAAMLQARALALTDGTAERLTFAVSRAGELAPGDLVRVTTATGVALLVAGSVTSLPAVAGDPRRRVAVRPADGTVVWLSRATPPAGTRGLAAYRDEDGREALADARVAAAAAADGRATVELRTQTAPAEGSLVRLELGDGTWWLVASAVRGSSRSDPAAQPALEVSGRLSQPSGPAGLPARLGPDDLAELLTFELRVRRGREESWSLPDLGFAPGHPRYAGDLPTDLDLYRDREGEPFFQAPALWASAASPRFPLAGPAGGGLLLPLGMPAVEMGFAGPRAPAQPPMVRDGLAPFGASMFLDHALRGAGVRTLLQTADEVRFRPERPRSLDGIHALIGLDEVTLAAVPDAVQRPARPRTEAAATPPDASEPLVRPEWWRFLPCGRLADDDPAALPISEHYLCATGRLPGIPELFAGPPLPNGSFELRWSRTEGGAAVRYVLAEAASPDWSDATVAYAGGATRRWMADRVGTRYHRVRAQDGDASTDWSNPVVVHAPGPRARRVSKPEAGHFLACGVTRVIAPPQLTQPTVDSRGGYTVAWLPVADPGAVYVLEEATDPAWASAREAYRGPGLALELYGRATGIYYYRVRVILGAASSDWSTGIAVRVAPGASWVFDDPADYAPDALLEVQRALMRLCAARGDVLAVLALPEHYREDDAVAHAHALRGADPTGLADSSPASFAALYHPWITTPDPLDPQAFRITPPDGATAGIMARRAARRGAWIAPANDPLRDVVLLSPAIAPEAHARLLAAQVNLVRQEPRGFVSLSADTLGDDPELRSIGVRRLLALLRRAALLVGPRYVFEPNDDTLRRGVQIGFEAMLTRLYALGAFSGASVDQAFRVVTGSPPNTPQSIDAGRLAVELKVAVAHPIAVLTVRLVQAGDGTVTVESR